jgi:hypothetical protein
LLMWNGLPSVDIVIGAEVFLCMTEPVLGVGQSLNVGNVVTTIGREVVLFRR